MAIDTETMQLIERIVARSIANATSLKGAADEITKGVTQYVGARYVPLFAEPLEWDNTKAYEPLTIVLHQGASYTSRQYVPVGVEIDNDSFWALTGNYNAQVEQYRQEVKSLDGRITANANAIDTETTNRAAAVTAEMERAQSAEHVLQANIDAEKTRAEGAEQTLQANIDAEKTRAEGAEQTLQANIATKATFFKSLDELKKSNLPVDTYAHIDYIHDGNKLGSGFYKITETVNQFSYQMDNGNYASLIYDDSASVDTFGANGDGVTDDSTIFQTIVNAGIPLNLNKRTYLIDQPVICNGTLKMNGISRDTDSSKIKFSKTGYIDVNQHKVNVADICFEGYAEADKTENGFINLHAEISFTNVQARFIKTFLKYASNVWGGFGVFNNCKIVYCDTAVNAPDSLRFNQNVFNSCIFQHYKNLFDTQRCEALYFNGCDFENSEDGIILGAGKSPSEFYGVNFVSCYLESQGKLMSSAWGCNILFESCWFNFSLDTYILENVSGRVDRTLVTFKNNVLNKKDIIKDSTIYVFFENNTVQDKPLNTGYTGKIADAGFSRLLNIENDTEAITISGTSGQNARIVGMLNVGAANELPPADSIRTSNHTLFAFVRDTKKLMYFNTESWVEVTVA